MENLPSAESIARKAMDETAQAAGHASRAAGHASPDLEVKLNVIAGELDLLHKRLADVVQELEALQKSE